MAEAMASLEKGKWKKTMDKEMESLRKNGVWELVELSKDRKAVGSTCKWYLSLRLILMDLLNVTRPNSWLKVFLKSMVWTTMKHSPR